jgi:flavin-binding protein dodecin
VQESIIESNIEIEIEIDKGCSTLIEIEIEIDKGSSTMSISNTISIAEKIDRGRSTLHEIDKGRSTQHEIEIEIGNLININVMLRPKPSR